MVRCRASGTQGAEIERASSVSSRGLAGEDSNPSFFRILQRVVHAGDAFFERLIPVRPWLNWLVGRRNHGLVGVPFMMNGGDLKGAVAGIGSAIHKQIHPSDIACKI